jgi:hypothetical protein
MSDASLAAQLRDDASFQRTQYWNTGIKRGSPTGGGYEQQHGEFGAPGSPSNVAGGPLQNFSLSAAGRRKVKRAVTTDISRDGLADPRLRDFPAITVGSPAT